MPTFMGALMHSSTFCCLLLRALARHILGAVSLLAGSRVLGQGRQLPAARASTCMLAWHIVASGLVVPACIGCACIVALL